MAEDQAQGVLCWVEWGTRRFPLSAGEHVIGRDPDVEIRLDASTVSRRHARLVVSAKETVLEDFGSKNGSFRGQARVTSPIQLADGDAIRFGSVLITFHVRTTLDGDPGRVRAIIRLPHEPLDRGACRPL